MAGGISNGSSCGDTIWAMSVQGSRKDKEMACDLLQRYGINTSQLPTLLRYMNVLYQQGILGPGKKIDCDLPMDLFGKPEFFHSAARKVILREGIGNVLSEGCARAAEAWGRLKDDTDSGLLALPNWGYIQHYDPRIEVEWSYGSILGERDINEHSINMALQKMPSMTINAGMDPVLPAEKAVEMVAARVLPYEGDPFMFDYGEGPTGIYSDHRVKTIAWHRHYTRFWLQSILFCDWVWPQFFTPNRADKHGTTPEGEPRFFHAVTGKNISFVEGMELGRKIWNLDRSIWVLQGRHRDMEVHAGYVYTVPTESPYYVPVYKSGKWTYDANVGRVLNKTKFEEWKTRFYNFEDWNSANGWPKRKTLESLGLKKVADTMQTRNKLD